MAHQAALHDLRLRETVRRPGAPVCIYFPRNHESSSDPVNDEAQAAVVEAAPGDGEVVLVVDDEPSIRIW